MKPWLLALALCAVTAPALGQTSEELDDDGEGDVVEEPSEPPPAPPPRRARSHTRRHYERRMMVWEPPPPPRIHHRAPRSSVWLGARVGWFSPFGGIYVQNSAADGYLLQETVPMRDYLSGGPLLEADVGVRVARYYTVFVLWERAQLGAGRGDAGRLGSHGTFDGGDSDYWGLGLRASTNPDRVGFVTELTLGYRRARAKFGDGTTLELTDGILDARVGFGADVRLSRSFTLSPMLTFGAGLFGDVELVGRDGRAVDLLRGNDLDGHGWFTLHMGGHFELAAD